MYKNELIAQETAVVLLERESFRVYEFGTTVHSRSFVGGTYNKLCREELTNLQLSMKNLLNILLNLNLFLTLLIFAEEF